eukprot:scpid54851/ scgid18957/ 
MWVSYSTANAHKHVWESFSTASIHTHCETSEKKDKCMQASAVSMQPAGQGVIQTLFVRTILWFWLLHATWKLDMAKLFVHMWMRLYTKTTHWHVVCGSRGPVMVHHVSKKMLAGTNNTENNSDKNNNISISILKPDNTRRISKAYLCS